MEKELKKIFIVFVFSLLVSHFFAQPKENFFWDSVQEISEKNSYFPVSFADSSNAYVFFESVDKAKKEIRISW